MFIQGHRSVRKQKRLQQLSHKLFSQFWIEFGILLIVVCLMDLIFILFPQSLSEGEKSAWFVDRDH